MQVFAPPTRTTETCDFAGTKKLLSELTDKKLAEAALTKLATLATDKSMEGMLVTALPAMIECVGDKAKKVQTAAEEAIRQIITNCSVWAGALVLPMLMKGMQGKPAQKVLCLQMVTAVAKRCPKQVGQGIVELIPVVTGTTLFTALLRCYHIL